MNHPNQTDDPTAEPLDGGPAPEMSPEQEAELASPPPPPAPAPAAPDHEGRWEALLRDTEAAHARELAEHREKASRWETAFKQALLEREIAARLSARPLVAGAAGQLIRLWKDELEVVATDGDFKVRARDGRTVDQAVADWLAAPEYAHFARPNTRGGTSGRGDSPAGAPGPGPASPPRTLGEAVLLRWREATDRSSGGTPGMPRLTPRRPR
jgi:hypothetical protein